MLRDEREKIEEDKKKKLKDIELWNRSVKEEEKLAVVKYAKEKGQNEAQDINNAILEFNKKKEEDKKALMTAKDQFSAYMQ